MYHYSGSLQGAGIFMLRIYKTDYLIYSEVRHVSLG
ncbi:hypothetical protein ABH957_005711 [Bacillus sp. RC242]